MPECVLVVEDDEEIATLIPDALADEGYTTLCACGPAALRAAAHAHPSVVLLDLNMPHIDGIEMARRLHADAATASLPIIVMSARLDARDAARRIGAVGVLEKPFSLVQLVTTVATYAGTP